jgi:hypothetical protein
MKALSWLGRTAAAALALTAAVACNDVLGIVELARRAPDAGENGDDAETPSDDSGGIPDATVGGAEGGTERDSALDERGADQGAGPEVGSLDSGVEDGRVSEADSGDGEAGPVCVSGAPCEVDAAVCQLGAIACDGGLPQCVAQAAKDGTLCDDAGSVCVSGMCSPCKAGLDCSAAGSCQKAQLSCTMGTQCIPQGNQPNGFTCDDHNACTQTDTCQSGVCTGANPITCTASDSCHVAGTCDSTTGVCSNPPAMNGYPCDDKNGCTQTDTCQGGVCTGSNSIVCGASDPCHNSGMCDPTTGTCSNPPANGKPCDDGNPCTTGDTCSGGTCSGTSVSCPAPDACHSAGTCSGGTCGGYMPLTGGPCGSGRVCSNGMCVAGCAAPGAPTGVSAALQSDGLSVGTAIVSWTAPADNGCPISSYTVHEINSKVPDLSGVAQSPATVDLLAYAQSYQFTVTAINSVGPGPASPPTTAIMTGCSLDTAYIYPVDYVSIAYVSGGPLAADNYLYARKDSSWDITGWVKFDVSSVPKTAAIKAMALILMPNQINQGGNPVLEVSYSSATGWSRSSNPPPGPSDVPRSATVSSTYPSPTMLAAETLSIDITAHDFTVDVAAGFVTLGVTSVGTAGFNQYLGSDSPPGSKPDLMIKYCP